MKILLFLAAAAVAMAQSVLRMDPPVITACDNGVAGQATIFWQAPGAGPVTLFAADTPMTGPEPGTGATRTGSWVTDGMIFTLRDAYGQALATTSAVVKCDAGGWFPLDVGNEWHFRRNDRIITGAHCVWRVVRKEQVNGVTWAVLSGTPTPSHHAWEPALLEKGYHMAYFDGVNRYYLAWEQRSLLGRLMVPPNVWDQYERASEREMQARIKALEKR